MVTDTGHYSGVLKYPGKYLVLVFWSVPIKVKEGPRMYIAVTKTSRNVQMAIGDFDESNKSNSKSETVTPILRYW